MSNKLMNPFDGFMEFPTETLLAVHSHTGYVVQTSPIPDVTLKRYNNFLTYQNCYLSI